MILPITLTLAGAAALLNIWIAQRVGRARVAHKVSIGDGGNDALTARMRAHSNYVEYTPFVLILVLLIELAKGSELWLWIVGLAYVLARIAHVFGMEPHGRFGKLRLVGIVVTMLVLLGLALYAIFISYMDAPDRNGRSEAPVSTAQAPGR